MPAKIVVTKEMALLLTEHIAVLGLDTRDSNQLVEKFRIRTVGQLLNLTEKDFLDESGFGQLTLDKVRTALAAKGFVAE